MISGAQNLLRGTNNNEIMRERERERERERKDVYYIAISRRNALNVPTVAFQLRS
jgi:hypothetical protein